MVLLCEYFTRGSELHQALFENKPEIYELASGLYGPGALAAWYLLVAAVLVDWISVPAGLGNSRLLSFSNELFVVLIYPAFAATDLLVQTVQQFGVDGRAKSLTCLIVGVSVGSGAGPKIESSAHIDPELLSLGQKVVGITGPLTPCLLYTICYSVVRSFSWAPAGPLSVRVRSTLRARIAIDAVAVYTSISIAVFHLALDDLLASWCLFSFDFVLILSPLVMFNAMAMIVVTQADVRWGLNLKLAAVFFGLLCFLFLFLGFARFLGSDFTFFKRLLIPDMGVSIVEKDQMATLLTTGLAFVYVCGSAWRRYRKRREGGLNAMPENNPVH